MPFVFRTAQWVVLFPLWQLLFPNNITSQFLATSGTALTWIFVGSMLGEGGPRQTSPVQASAATPTVEAVVPTLAGSAAPEPEEVETPEPAPTVTPMPRPTASPTSRPVATIAPSTPTATPTPEPTSTALPVHSTATPAFNPRLYLGQGDRFNCGHFASQADAQAVLRAGPSDPNRLDGNDRDGIACETNPDPHDRVPVPRP